MLLKSAQNSKHLKIIRFFLDNPNSIDTPRGISAWTNISLPETRKILEELVKIGTLKAFRTSSTVGYSLTESKKHLYSLERMIKKNLS